MRDASVHQPGSYVRDGIFAANNEPRIRIIVLSGLMCTLMCMFDNSATCERNKGFFIRQQLAIGRRILDSKCVRFPISLFFFRART